MYLNRVIDIELIRWKESINRKPLMLRGARQVGKTSTIRHFSTQFAYYVEINLDENKKFKEVFEKNDSVFEVIEQLSVLCNTRIIPGQTLLFIDEIQVSKEAISMLRYFYEKVPDLHVIAAGSLLEFALANIPSFGVGRVRSIFMFPLSFREFLEAEGEILLLEHLDKSNFNKPLSNPILEKIIQHYKKFLVVGGMPEAVKTYVTTKDLIEVQRILDDIIISFQTDFPKYKITIPSNRLVEVFEAISLQVATKFTYTYPNATLNNKQIKEAIRLLQMAGLIYGVTHSASNGIPLGAEINPKKTKYLIFDTGIFQRILGLQIADLLMSDDFNSINKGNIAELFVGLELIKNADCYSRTELYYWQRERKNSQAEVDYVFQSGKQIIPIEVKAGTKGSMQSLYIFLNEKQLEKGYRLSLENYIKMDSVLIIPIFAAYKFQTAFKSIDGL
ncbi:MAG: ATP-binding protein [Bacteroidales bacterium]|nr:ATP-binding protein [Bacteroidales bacterium]